MPFLKRIRIDWFVVALLGITIGLIISNYTPGTYMSGWDTIQPELNPSLYWERITHVWQEHQGLGAPPSQSHAAEIPRMLIVSLLSALLPVELVRYAFFWITMILGPLGMYYFIMYMTSKEDRSHTNVFKIHNIGAFLGALLYLLNIGTVQQYIVILEMFAIKFAALGFIFLFITRFIDTGRRRDLAWFALTIIFSSGMAHTATLWYVFFVGITGYALLYSLLHTFSHKNRHWEFLRRGLVTVLITLLLNLYWILPNLYYSFHYGQDVITSKIHRLFSEEAYLNNRDYGSVDDLLLFRNFLFNWYVAEPLLAPDGALVNTIFKEKLLAAWVEHLKNPFVVMVAFLFSALALVGAFFGARRRNMIVWTLIPLTAGCAFFLLADTPGISQISTWLREQNSLMKEILRFPFTKFSFYYIFGISAFFGYAMVVLLRILQQYRLNHILSSALFTYIMTFCILIYALPAFQGHYISKILRVRIPYEYTNMFKRFGDLEGGRVLTLPINSLYGWVTYQWDMKPAEVYQGAGFTWFGLSQPTLNREFDRWYFPNEQSYREFFYAVYSKQPDLFVSLLEKYNIESIMLDENVSYPGDPLERRKLFYTELREMLDEELSEDIVLSYQYGTNIRIYTYLPNKDKQPVALLQQYDNVHPPFRWNYMDYAYLSQGDYISTPYNSKDNTPAGTALENSLIFPARSMLDDKERIYQTIINLSNDTYFLRTQDDAAEGGQFISSPVASSEAILPVRVSVRNENNEQLLHLSYLVPHLKFTDPPSDHVVLPDDANQVIIEGNLFNIATAGANLTETQYLGDLLINTAKPVVIEPIRPDGSYGEQRTFLPNLIKPVTVNSNRLDLQSTTYEGEENVLSIEQVTKQPVDCTIDRAAMLRKQYVEGDSGEIIIRYRTVDGTLCDTITFDNVPQTTGYILAIESRHISGLPLRICVDDNTTSQCILDDELSKFETFQKDYFVIPPYQNEDGYTIAIRNISIGSVESVNETRDIRLIPIPYTLMQSLAYTPPDYTEHLATDPFRVQKVEKDSPTRYRAQLSGAAAQDVITLDQAYETGWHAYYVDSTLGRIFPPLFGSRLEQHILVNNWQNGWIVPADIAQSLRNGEIVFEYLPQYLLVSGWIMFAVALWIAIPFRTVVSTLGTHIKRLFHLLSRL